MFESSIKQNRGMKLSIAILLSVIFTIVAVTVFVKYVKFYQGCEGHLGLAASANTIDAAKSELRIAVNYIEKKNLTSGYTSIFFETPDEDIGFWYQNLKSSYYELDSLGKDTSPLERSNMLIKLRETLIDHGKNGDHVTAPNGISKYPNNSMYFILLLSSLIGAIIAWLFWLADTGF